MLVVVKYNNTDILKLIYHKISKLISSQHFQVALEYTSFFEIVEFIEIFEKHPRILSKYQKLWKYILVDEYQDTNKAQFLLVKMLADKHRNICVVGDDDQSIYGWRGADIRNIDEFDKDFSNAKTIVLDRNYRSTQKILDAANSVISINKNRKSKNLWTD